MYQAAACDLEAATCGISSKFSFHQCPSTCTALLLSVPMMKEILQRKLGLKDPRGVRCPFSVPRPKIARIAASTEMLRILYESEENHF
jgi:hypothetical protein